MALEAINWVSDLVITNPLAADFLTEGDDHIKGIKVALKNSFPSVAGAVSATHTELSLLSGVTGAIRTSTSTPQAGEWVLMRQVDTVGAPAAIDFINGSGGVTISTAYDAYLIDLQDINNNTSGTALLRLQLSINAGSTFASLVVNAQSSTLSSGTQTNTNHAALTHFPVTGPSTAGATTLVASMTAQIMLQQSRDNPSIIGIQSEFQQAQGLKGGWVSGQADATGASAFDAVRLSWDANNFLGSNGRIRFFGRKV